MSCCPLFFPEKSLVEKNNAQNDQDDQQDAEYHGQVENNFFNAAPGSKNGSRITPGNAPHPDAAVLQYDQDDCCNRSNDQGNVKKCFHFDSPIPFSSLQV